MLRTWYMFIYGECRMVDFFYVWGLTSGTGFSFTLCNFTNYDTILDPPSRVPTILVLEDQLASRNESFGMRPCGAPLIRLASFNSVAYVKEPPIVCLVT